MIERNSVQGVMDYFQCLGIHLRRESDKYQTLHGLPSTSKRKLRKRRSRPLRSGSNTVVEQIVHRQITRSQQSEKLKVQPSPPSSSILAQKDEKLIRLNADTLVRIICFILVLMVMFNALLFYKLWSLEAAANVLYLPNSQDALQSLRNNPPKSTEEWIKLLSRQQQFHDAEMCKWRDLLNASIAMVDQMKQTLLTLKDHIDLSRDRIYSAEQTCDHKQPYCNMDREPGS